MSSSTGVKLVPGVIDRNRPPRYDVFVNGFDGLLVLIACFAVFIGLWKGFARILIGMAALVAAFLVASRFDRALVPALRFLHASDETLRFVGYVLLFLGVLVAGAVLGRLVRKLLTAVALGWADRLAGGAVALVGALLAGAFLLLPVVAFLPGGVDAIAGSKLAPYVAAVSDVANLAAPDDLSHRWHARIEALRKRWRGGGAREVVLLRTR